MPHFNKTVEDLRPIPGSDMKVNEQGQLVCLKYEGSSDTWVGPEKSVFIRNLFLPDQPVWIRIDQRFWRSRYLGKIYSLNWDRVGLPVGIERPLRHAIALKLRRCAQSRLNSWQSSIGRLGRIYNQCGDHFPSQLHELGNDHWAEIISKLSAENASTIRALYAELANASAYGADKEILRWLQDTKLTKAKGGVLYQVRSWDVQQGALTTAELEVLRSCLLPPKHEEKDTEHFIRVLFRSLVALGKRPIQMLRVAADGVRQFPQDPSFPAFIVVPGAKAQARNDPDWWPITDELYQDLKNYSLRPEVRRAQQKYGYFFVTPIKAQSRLSGPRSSGAVNEIWRRWLNSQELISPRTGRKLHVHARRIRHTVATQMARKGYALTDIRAALEHDSNNAVLAYLDAVGNDMTPSLERANDALGDIFSKMSEAYFKGKIICRPTGKVKKPVVVPNKEPAWPIGQCGKVGSCNKHPFHACFNGCSYFLLFKDADTASALRTVRDEASRWRLSEPSAIHSRAHDDFARLEAAITEATAKQKVHLE
jgi:hypothetical protein